MSAHCYCLTFEPGHDKTYNKTFAISEDSDQAEHPYSPIRVFAYRMRLLKFPGYPKRDKRELLFPFRVNTFHYENKPIQIYWKFYHQKNESFQMKNSKIFHISAQNLNCGYSLESPRRGDSNEYPQSIFWAEVRKIMYTPVNPSFTI